MLIKIIPKDKNVSAITIASRVFARLDPVLQQCEGFDDLSVIAENEDTFVLKVDPERRGIILAYISGLENEFNFSIKLLK